MFLILSFISKLVALIPIDRCNTLTQNLLGASRIVKTIKDSWGQKVWEVLPEKSNSPTNTQGNLYKEFHVLLLEIEKLERN